MPDISESTVTGSALPWPCILQILQHVPLVERVKLRRVCKTWRNSVDYCWRLTSGLRMNDSEELRDTIRIKVPTISTRSFTLAKEIITKCAPYLTTLEVTQDGTSGRCPLLSLVRDHCCKLKNLTVYIKSEEHEETLCAILENNPHLRRLDVSIHDGKLCNFFGVLSALHLKDLGIHVKDRFVRFENSLGRLEYEEPRQCIENLIDFLSVSNLNKLTVSTAPPRLLRAVGEKVNLESLEIFQSLVVDDHPVKWQYLLNLRNLKRIVISQTYVKISGNSRMVKPLAPITDEVVEKLVQSCPLLEDVTLENWSQLTDRSIRALSVLQNLRKLKISMHQFSQAITDRLLMNLTNIRELCLIRCDEVRDAGVIELLRRCQNIRHLTLIGCSITNDSLRAAIQETARRRNRVKLVMYVGECQANASAVVNDSPLLEIVTTSLLINYVTNSFTV